MSELSIPNTMNFIVQVSCDAIDANISSTQGAEIGSEQTNDALTTLNTAWTTAMPTGVPALLPNDQNNTGNLTYEEILDNSTTPTAIDQFIAAYIDTKDVSLANSFSSAFITKVISQIQKAYQNPGSNSNSSLDLAACNAMNTLISSTSTEETQPLQTLSRTYNSLLQQCQSAMTSLAGIGDAASDGNSSIIALLSQQY